jgi:predicted RNase H-like HicB family nuclease
MNGFFGFGFFPIRGRRFNFVVERGDDGIWVAECVEVRGAFGQGPTSAAAVEDASSAVQDILELRLREARRTRTSTMKRAWVDA